MISDVNCRFFQFSSETFGCFISFGKEFVLKPRIKISRKSLIAGTGKYKLIHNW